MDIHEKRNILNLCNSIEIDSLDKVVASGAISIEEFEHANLDLYVLEELTKRSNLRKGIIEKAVISPTSQPPSVIERIINKEASVTEIYTNLRTNVYTVDDLLSAGISQALIDKINYSVSRSVPAPRIEDLPVMQDGRTDVYFIGLPAAGKSTMLGGMLQYTHRAGIIMPDAYNNSGNKYQQALISDINKGILPKGTQAGSYNYIATSIKDREGTTHPFNIVEVPGENYNSILDTGIGIGDARDYITPFIDYIKNDNKKILIFVIDAIAHELRNTVQYYNAFDQSIVYINILNMFRDYGILDRTDAIYLVVNKFDFLQKDKYVFSNQSDAENARDYLQEEFGALIMNCKDARTRKRNYSIRVFPFSIGNVEYGEFIGTLNSQYSQELVDALLDDSFVLKGGRFWEKKKH